MAHPLVLPTGKKESLATFCSKAMSKVGIHKSPRNDTPHQPGQQTGMYVCMCMYLCLFVCWLDVA